MIAAWALGLLLVVALPWRALRNSRNPKPPRNRSRRYWLTTAEIIGLLVGLGAVAFLNSVSSAELGLAWPPGRGGWVGLLIGSALIVGLLIAVLVVKPKRSNAREQEALSQLPQDREEMLAYVTFMPFAGFGWEFLYRGFLLWWLTPLTGIVGAVVIASIAYGLAHGWKNRTQGFGSILSAFLFTIGYALSGSLWWLILVHTALPLIALISGWRARATQPEVQPA